MNQQLDLEQYPYSQDTDTSKAAAESVKDAARTFRKKIHVLLGGLYPAGATSEELSKHLLVDYGTIQPRTSELRDSLIIMDSGARRDNESGKAAIVWRIIITPEEKAVAEKQQIERIRTIGNKALCKEMFRTAYAYANKPVAHNKINMDQAAVKWMEAFAGEIGNIKYAIE